VFLFSRWYCSSCKEDFREVNYRYKLVLEISDGYDFKIVTVFGRQLEALFGVSANEFNAYYKLNLFYV
jgi:hypothetical protein